MNLSIHCALPPYSPRLTVPARTHAHTITHAHKNTRTQEHTHKNTHARAHTLTHTHTQGAGTAVEFGLALAEALDGPAVRADIAKSICTMPAVFR